MPALAGRHVHDAVLLAADKGLVDAARWQAYRAIAWHPTAEADTVSVRTSRACGPKARVNASWLS